MKCVRRGVEEIRLRENKIAILPPTDVILTRKINICNFDNFETKKTSSLFLAPSQERILFFVFGLKKCITGGCLADHLRILARDEKRRKFDNPRIDPQLGTEPDDVDVLEDRDLELGGEGGTSNAGIDDLLDDTSAILKSIVTY